MFHVCRYGQLSSLAGGDRVPPVPNLYVARLDFLECFSHLKLLLVKKKPDIFGMPGLLLRYG